MRRISRRVVLAVPTLLLAPAAWAASPPPFPAVRAGAALSFPRDHGAHPEFRTEWWYVTGWLKTPEGRDLGFQITFFRSRLAVDPENPSAFSPGQILFAHAGLSDPTVGRLLHDGRIARQGLGLAQASTEDADVTIDDWRFRRGADGRFTAQVAGREFALDLVITPTQPVLLQGEGGFSRKGPLSTQASHYYSLPHLAVSGAVARGRRRVAVTGKAWMDHEWSSTLLDPRAVGWDWVGLNLDDGGALTAFQVRDRAGRAIWAGGSLRAPDGRVTTFRPGDVQFTTTRHWRSPRTGGRYPVERVVEVRTPKGARSFPLTPVFDDQELDSRQTGGPVYWEGAVRTVGGRGYLELTGYVSPLTL
ncbi:lipocalin-like domain-containing protein [Phenylobacterium sp.]|uniref:lipocalin-like domain-containing protein n=1 Tax=Phenylobacterium sp. TaxID=1871053 RepID=UPI003983A3E3